MQSFDIRTIGPDEVGALTEAMQGNDFTSEVARHALGAKEAEIVGAFSDGHLKAVASYRRGDKTKLISMASFAKGGGRALLTHIRQFGPVWCKGVESASGFYERMGMVKGEKIKVGERTAYIYADNIP